MPRQATGLSSGVAGPMMEPFMQTYAALEETRELLALSEGDLKAKVVSALAIAVDVFRTGLVDCEAGMMLSRYLETVTAEQVIEAAQRINSAHN